MTNFGGNRMTDAVSAIIGRTPFRLPLRWRNQQMNGPKVAPGRSRVSIGAKKRPQSAIKVARESGQIYALAPPNRPHEFRYPRWQFDVEPGRLRAALAPFMQANASSWAVHNFIQRPMEALDGLRPMDSLCDPERPIGDVVELAAQRYNSDQGAG